jgi:hypothetical protein
MAILKTLAVATLMAVLILGAAFLLYYFVRNIIDCLPNANDEED